MTPLLQGAERCPHCGGLTVIEPSLPLRWRCAACGGGRVPGLEGAALKPHAMQKLVEARAERAAQVGAGVFAIVFLLGAVMAGVVAAVAFALGASVAGGVIAAMAGGAAVGVASMRRLARKNGAASRAALDEAWAEAAAEIIARRGSITMPELAKVMRMSEGDAESILARVSVGGARVDVDDDAELRYRIDAQALESRGPGVEGAGVEGASAMNETDHTSSTKTNGGSHAR